jgi:hypothetical protein
VAFSVVGAAVSGSLWVEAGFVMKRYSRVVSEEKIITYNKNGPGYSL